MEIEHYIGGQHNEGVYNSFNLNMYGYCYQNPVLLVDLLGKQVWSRILGGVKAVGRALLIAPEPTMVTKAAGVVVEAHCADIANSGLRQMWTREDINSLTSKVLKAAGMSKQDAEIIGTAGIGAISKTSKVGMLTNAV